MSFAGPTRNRTHVGVPTQQRVGTLTGEVERLLRALSLPVAASGPVVPPDWGGPILRALADRTGLTEQQISTLGSREGWWPWTPRQLAAALATEAPEPSPEAVANAPGPPDEAADDDEPEPPGEHSRRLSVTQAQALGWLAKLGARLTFDPDAGAWVRCDGEAHRVPQQSARSLVDHRWIERCGDSYTITDHGRDVLAAGRFYPRKDTP